MFWLKKLLSPLFMPLSLVLLGGALGTLLAWSRRWHRAGRVLFTLAILVLLLAGNGWVSKALIRPLELRYPPVRELGPGAPLPPALAACRFVVVLGGGHDDSEILPAFTRLSPSSQARLVEAVRLLRRLPDATLVVSGPVMHAGGPTHAQVLADAAVSLGVPRARIVLIDDARDTHEETLRLRALCGPAPLALVTSAWHMPRAMALATAAGLHALPCPTDYLGSPDAPWRWSDGGWDVPSLERSTDAVHERLGLWWERLRGQI